jgi:hypothetical protein
VTRKPSGPTGAEGPSEDFYDELQVSSDTQAVRSHRSDGDGEQSHRLDGDGERSHRYT